jgi:hypothetical protein
MGFAAISGSTARTCFGIAPRLRLPRTHEETEALIGAADSVRVEVIRRNTCHALSPGSLRASVGSTEAANEVVARFGVVGPTQTRTA